MFTVTMHVYLVGCYLTENMLCRALKIRHEEGDKALITVDSVTVSLKELSVSYPMYLYLLKLTKKCVHISFPRVGGRKQMKGLYEFI